MIYILMLAAAGAALIAQNLVMARISAGPGVLAALFLNSAIGLVLLSAMLWLRAGSGGFSGALAQISKGWGLLPGLLGVFIVFATLTGFRQLGAASAFAIIVASQLSAAVLIDLWRGQLNGGLAQPLLGMALLLTGAALVIWR